MPQYDNIGSIMTDRGGMFVPMPVVVRGAAGLAPGGCALFACQHNVYSTIQGRRAFSPMTYVITEPCINVKDASCVAVCPVDCIYSTDADDMYYINPDECIDCGACEPECPVTAIFAEDEVPSQYQRFIALNAAYFAKTT